MWTYKLKRWPLPLHCAVLNNEAKAEGLQCDIYSDRNTNRTNLFKLTQVLQWTAAAKGERLREWTGSIGSVCVQPRSSLSIYPGFQVCEDGCHPGGGDVICIWRGRWRWRKCISAGPPLPPVEEHPWRPVSLCTDSIHGAPRQHQWATVVFVGLVYWLERPTPPTSWTLLLQRGSLEAARLLNSGHTLQKQCGLRVFV